MENISADLPLSIDTGAYKSGHIQGIAIDPVKRFLYCSYTTMLVKLDFSGNLIGSVEGLTGHLGCIDFNDGDGKVYGSLEYKNDAIGRGIRKNLYAGTEDEDVETAFFIAVFDVDKIDRPHMDACADGVMKTVWLKEVVDDFNAAGEDGKPHRFACSGIDGTAFGPKFGCADGKNYLTVAYGIYSDLNRTDNDRQVILQYDISGWSALLRPLSQTAFHKSGPARPDGKYFLFTGNTNWGVQNLEYDEYVGDWLFFVYPGKKPQYPNFPLFAVRGADAPRINAAGEAELSLKPEGAFDPASGTYGWLCRYGAEGFYSFGSGYYYAAFPEKRGDLQSAVVRLFERDQNALVLFRPV